MIPDKIYCWKGTLGSFYASPQKQKEIKTEEYLRKGALLEWAREKKKRLDTMFDFVPSMVLGAEIKAYKEFIDKIQSL